MVISQEILAMIQSSSLTRITGMEVFTFTSENDSATMTVPNVTVTSGNIKSFSYVPIETTTTSLNDFKTNGVQLNVANIVDNVSFDLVCTANNNATGNYLIQYLIIV